MRFSLFTRSSPSVSLKSSELERTVAVDTATEGDLKDLSVLVELVLTGEAYLAGVLK